MDTIETMLNHFYDGSIRPSELERLCGAFLHDGGVRERWPEDAAVILPLALARMDARPQTGPRRRIWRVAAAAIGLAALAGTATAYAAGQRYQVYSTDGACGRACAELWLQNTLETAL